MSDIKSLLKEARKLIDDKNFKEAQECCKNILRKDKQNYLALVLLGKSMQDSDQAPLAFQKAISCKADNPLAWQGLANYYEKQYDSESKNKLLSIYDNMLNLQLDEDKITEILDKLVQLGTLLKFDETINILIGFINKSPAIKQKEAAEKHVHTLINAGIKCRNEDITFVLKILQEMYLKNPSDSLEMSMVLVTLQKEDIVQALEEIINFNYFSKNKKIGEFICKFLCKTFSENDSFLGFELFQIENLLKGIEKSESASLLESMYLFEKSEYLEAYKNSIPLMNHSFPDFVTSKFVVRCTMKLKKWDVSQKLITNFLTKIKDPDSVLELKKYLFLSLFKQRKWDEAVAALKDVTVESLSETEKANLAECYIHEGLNASTIISMLQGTCHYVLLQSLKLFKDEKYSELVDLIRSSQYNEEPLCLLYLGKSYWELKLYDECQLHLLKSAKLDPENSETFLYLGHFYKAHSTNYEKAKKCYEKAYNLNSNGNDIIKNLSELYSKLKLSDKDFELLSAANNNPELKESWINFRLGLHFLNRRDWENAILQFRNVIKKDHSSSVAFECLADAYFSRGSYTSALRAYEKVIILAPNRSIYCNTRVGYIYCILTQYSESIKTFMKVLNEDPNSLLALKGLSETWMRVAKKKIESQLYGSARDSAQQTVNCIMSALSNFKQYNCLWKILGDTLMFITTLPQSNAFVHMKPLFNDNVQDTIKLDRANIFQQAIGCYARIVKSKQQTSSFDLALAYYNYYCESKQNVDLNIAFSLTIACIREKPSLWRNWNLLGRIHFSIKKYNIAQHCFVKALQVTKKWSIAKIWCNLGMLYVKVKQYKVANYCFWRGQSTLPSYPHSWIGQGLIAEEIREEEAMDLFRHASRLGYHRESALGYANWVCRTLKESVTLTKPDTESQYVIEGLHANTYAIDLMEWFSCYEPDDPCARNFLGILQERCGLLETALKSYEKAFHFAKDDKKNIILLNLARVHLRRNEYDDAIKYYKAISEASLDSACGLALALYKKGLYEESYSTYDTALQWLCNHDTEKADLLVAMSGIVYMFKGANDAKTLLFHSIQISQKKPTAHSLYAICSLGLLNSDPTLSKLALTELRKYEKDPNCGFDIGFLKSFIQHKSSVQNALKVLSESVHDHPNNALLWFCMAQYCLRVFETKAKIASCCAQKALTMDYQKDAEWNSAKVLATASIAEHIAGDKDKAFTIAKKGLHMYPHQADIWAALLLSLLSHKSINNLKRWALSAANHMKERLELSKPLNDWVHILEKNISAS